ncbi:MAG: hypothetical protein D6820_00600 [Lentisphaerae bacterium]|nr:MAG: hypothetical protein D6820_00600 [Lentisphaerota bacterium]
MFEFVNLHYYYFYQRLWGVIEEAGRRDMGVFIISPNDKGGRLFDPPALLRDLTAPQSPLQFNARFCLRTPLVHTLSFGMDAPAQLRALPGIVRNGAQWDELDEQALKRLDAQLEKDPYSKLDATRLDPGESGINLYEVLRFRTMWKCYDMEGWCKYRYNMFQEKGDWFPGAFATKENLAKLPEEKIPEGVPLKALLREFHERFYIPKKG